MKIDEVFRNTFKALRRQLGHDAGKDCRPMWQQRLSADSDFCRAAVACGYLTREQMQHAAARYHLGRCRDGAVIYWQISPVGNIYDGKIMHYLPDCHRDHSRKPTWVSHLLKRQFLSRFPDMADCMPPSQHCLFGSHLLKPETFNLKPETMTVCVVEAEKTAVILSEHFPDHLWLAAGGLSELTADKLFPLRHHRITLFPDTDTELTAYSRWYAIAQEARRRYQLDITVSSLLELRTTEEQKQRKIDLVDFLFNS